MRGGLRGGLGGGLGAEVGFGAVEGGEERVEGGFVGFLRSFESEGGGKSGGTVY